jgi:magnesium transporter
MSATFELNKEYLELIKDAIESGKDNFLKDQLSDLHQADIAEIIDQLNLEDAKYLFKIIPNEKAAETLLELDEEVREKLLSSFTSQEIAVKIDDMDTDDATDIISELHEEKKQEVLSFLEDQKQATDIADLLTYDEDTAGGLMAKELIKVKHDWTVARCIREMRKQAEDISNIYTIYVVDDNDTLIGTLPLKKLLFNPASLRSTIKDVYVENVISAKVYQDVEEVAKMMEKYDLVVLPVVDDDNKLLGRITIDDVVDIIKEEAEKDYQMASGISEKVTTADSVWLLSRARIPWLVIGMVGGILGSQVIERYENQIQIHPELAFFIPLIAAMGGNAGVQSSAIVVQGLANKTIDFQSITSKLLKELLVGLINGLLCSLLILSYTVVFNQNINLALTAGVSLLTVVIYASFFGTLIPLLLDKYKIDPAVATGPFITTMNDVVGIFIYFFIGRLMYGI